MARFKIAQVAALAVGVGFLTRGPALAFEWEPLPEDLSRIDLSETPLVAIGRSTAGEERHDYAEYVELETGHIYYRRSYSPSSAYREQSRLDFKQWIKSTQLAKEPSADLSGLEIRSGYHGEGAMLYALVPLGVRTCVAFRVNTGRKKQVNQGYRASDALITGIHCRALGFEPEPRETLLADIEEIDIER